MEWNQLLNEEIKKNVDLIILDPPFGNLNKNNSNSDHPYLNESIDIKEICKSVRKVISKKGVILVFSRGIRSVEFIKNLNKWYRYSLVWDKCKVTGFLDTAKKPLVRHEDILVFSPSPVGDFTYNPYMSTGSAKYQPNLPKMNPDYMDSVYGKRKDGNREDTDKRFPQSIISIGFKNQEQIFPTQKPYDLIYRLVYMYSNPGDTVVDPFVGCGNTIVACDELGRIAICSDKDPKHTSMTALKSKRNRQENIKYSKINI